MMIDSPGISATISARSHPFAFVPFPLHEEVALLPLVVAGTHLLGPLRQRYFSPSIAATIFAVSVTVFAFSIAMKSTFVAT